ncbi:MAG: hypothetical protein ACLR4Z_07370 [Butyricicoccaceae bacterium]
MEDTVRDEAADAVRELKAQGITRTVLPDRRQRAIRTARLLMQQASIPFTSVSSQKKKPPKWIF